ncbi:hypothetical protein C7E13_05055 [Stenotrophomonas maltophilia]|nr:hypothetical protein C7E13_05055 [Stenotrophomonas maltophilia]
MIGRIGRIGEVLERRTPKILLAIIGEAWWAGAIRTAFADEATSMRMASRSSGRSCDASLGVSSRVFIFEPKSPCSGSMQLQ